MLQEKGKLLPTTSLSISDRALQVLRKSSSVAAPGISPTVNKGTVLVVAASLTSVELISVELKSIELASVELVSVELVWLSLGDAGLWCLIWKPKIC